MATTPPRLGSATPRGSDARRDRIRHVVIVGGGAAGTLAAVHLLRQADARHSITVVEPRETLGRGVAFGAPDPWHRLNVPAITMSGLPDDLDHFRAWADVEAHAFPPRLAYGAYLGALLAQSVAGSPASFDHVHSRVTRILDQRHVDRASPRLNIHLADGRTLHADGVVVATGNELPAPPPFLALLVAVADPRVIVNPWATGSLDGIGPGGRVGIIGTGHTAIDLAASLLRGRGVAEVIAVSRHGETPYAHEDPWRPRPPVPAFTAEEFAAFADPIAEARARFRAHPLGWRQALDSVRPINRELWLALDDATRRRFVTGHRREWEIHRSRLAPQVARDVAAWIEEGRLAVRAARIEAVSATSDGLRVAADTGDVTVDQLLLATGPSESSSASPLLAALVADGLARPGSMDLGIDADPYRYRVIDAAGRIDRPLFALGPIIRGAVWETIAVPEIRAQAVTIATGILAGD